MFDTNAFDNLYEAKLNYEQIRDKYEVYITTIQKAEMLNIPDSKKEKREKLLAIISLLSAKTVPTPFTWNHIDFSHLSFSSEPSYWTILKQTKSNKHDALIAATAVHNGCILVTDDTDLLKRMKRINRPVFTFAEFMFTLKGDYKTE